MKCVILSAGYGSRLAPLTKSLPKTLIPITQQKTILDFIIESIPDSVTEIIFILGYKKELVIDHLTDHHPKLEYQVFLDTEISGTFRAIKDFLHTIQEPDEKILLIHGDNIHQKKELEKAIKHDCFLGYTTKVKNKNHIRLNVANNKILSFERPVEGILKNDKTFNCICVFKKNICLDNSFFGVEKYFFYALIHGNKKKKNEIHTFESFFFSNNTPQELSVTRKFFEKNPNWVLEKN